MVFLTAVQQICIRSIENLGNLHKVMYGKGYLVAEGHGRGTKYHIPQVRKASDVSDNLGSNLGSKPK